MAKGKVELTVDDIIATLKNSHLPNVIVEGRDDLVIFRRIEEILSVHFVSVLPVGGQDKVLELFRRRREYSNGKKIVFVADRDRWVFEGVPPNLIDNLLVFTDGYSIENEAIRDANLEILMAPVERQQFRAELYITMKWFALAMSRYLAGKPEPLNIHPNHLFQQHNLDAYLSEMLVDDSDAINLHNQLIGDPLKFLRGKTLLALMMRQLSYAGRIVHHQPLSLLDTAGASPGPHLNTLFNKIRIALNV